MQAPLTQIYPQKHFRPSDNPFMDEKQLRQTLARNLERLMGEETQAAIAKRAGIAQSHVSRLLRCDAAATTDLLAALAGALGVQPWELLTDSESTRKAALERMILGGVPKEEAAPRRKKAKGDDSPAIQ